MSHTAVGEFLGRAADLDLLRSAWAALQQRRPQAVLLRGDSGIGKTRLLREFYRWLAAGQDGERYWGELPFDRNKALTLVPPVPPGPVADLPSIPWLWLALRCQDPTRATDDVAFDAVRHQLALHLATIFQTQQRRAVNTNLFKASFSLVTSFAFPGSGPVIAALNTALEASGGTLSAIEMFAAIKERVGSSRGSPATLKDFARREHDSIVTGAVRAFSALFQARQSNVAAPIVLVADDAHWMDPVTSEVLGCLLVAAGTEGWPLLVVLASWDEPLRFESANPHCAALRELIEIPRKGNGVVFHDRTLAPLGEADLRRIVSRRIPGLDEAAAAFLARRSAGDIDLLHDFLNELLESPDWLDADGRLTVSASTLQRLPSRAAEMARLRLNAAGVRIRETLTWASAQGMQFDEVVLVEFLSRLHRSPDVHSALEDADRTYGFLKTAPHRVSTLVGEFRRLVYFDACRDFYDRHPNARAYFIELGEVLRGILIGELWPTLDPADKLRLGRRLTELVSEQSLKGKYWIQPLYDLLLELARLRLQLGDARGAEGYADRLVRLRGVPAASKEAARKLLVSAAYMQGDIEKERLRLAEWKKDRRRSVDYAMCESAFLTRQGNGQRSIAIASAAVRAATTPESRIEAGLCAAAALWSAGRPIHAREAVVATDQELRSLKTPPSSLVLSMHHTSALVLHDLEKSAQVLFHVTECIRGYALAGDKQHEIISRVNLGDALWGVGRLRQAEQELRGAYEQASATRLPHAQDIAAICLGNVYRELGDTARARELMREGIEIADRIGHLWDKTYGELYLELLGVEEDPPAALGRFRELREAAERQQYTYLSALATAFAAVASAKLPSEVGPAPQSLDDFPIVACYWAAAAVHQSKAPTPPKVATFLQALGRCEGIKGDRRFILKALDQVEANGGLSDLLADFVRRWRGRFSWTSPVRRQMCVSACDYRTCEARCCYDGVYLVNDEEQRIRRVVAEQPAFFAHLPETFLVQGSWHGISGVKTAVRPQTYLSPDYPDHFPRTRCVFAFEDGGCSLQAFSEKYGSSAWEFKPMSCVMHPLSSSAEGATPPPALGVQDPTFVGLEYPGFASFTPCGQHRSDGVAWDQAFAAEIEYWKRMIP